VFLDLFGFFFETFDFDGHNLGTGKILCLFIFEDSLR